jgi:hypothetical protein
VDGQPFRLTPPTRKKAAKPFTLSAYREAERTSQIQCSSMLRGVLRPEVCWTAIDHSHSFNPTVGRNGRPIGLMEVIRRKAQGVEPGICDYLFWDASYGYAIEYKIDDGVLEDPQKIFIRRLLAAGVIVKVCWGAVQVMNTVFEWRLCRPQVKWEIR